MIDEKKLVEDIKEFMFNVYGCDLENVIEFQRGNESKSAYIVQGLCDAVEFIDNQSKIGEWIPCSERQPNESGYYFACVYNAEVDDYDFRKTWFAHVDDYDMEESEWRELYEFEVVTAWQPLPEPYREKVEE